jgi:hypothetical protein
MEIDQQFDEWFISSKPGESFIYHKGHLMEDVIFQYQLGLFAKKVLDLANKRKISIVQKRIKFGTERTKPEFEYIAQKN